MQRVWVDTNEVNEAHHLGTQFITRKIKRLGIQVNTTFGNTTHLGK